jgi:superoxide reductase
MAKKLEVYKCEICGNIVEVLHEGAGMLSCCGQPMKQLVENTTDAAKEKHVPVVEKRDDGTYIKVGSVPHPMTAEHQIEWVQMITPEGYSCRVFLAPGQNPEAVFAMKPAGGIAREFCNLHGLWKTEF